MARSKPGGFYANLSDSEKRYVQGAAVFFPLLAIVVGIIFFAQSIDEIEVETASYKANLDLLTTTAPAYLELKKNAQQATSHKKLDDETMMNNDIKLTSFVDAHADKAGLDVSSYDEDELPFGDKRETGPIIVERQLRVEIREAKMANLVQLMERIEDDTKPVFVKRIDIRKRGREPGDIRAILTVSTFVKRERSS